VEVRENERALCCSPSSWTWRVSFDVAPAYSAKGHRPAYKYWTGLFSQLRKGSAPLAKARLRRHWPLALEDIFQANDIRSLPHRELQAMLTLKGIKAPVPANVEVL